MSLRRVLGSFSVKRVAGTVALVVAVGLIVALVSVALDHRSQGTEQASRPRRGAPTTLPGPSAAVAADTLEAVSTKPVPLMSVANPAYALFGTGGCKPAPTLNVVAKGGRRVFPIVPPAKHLVRVVASTTKDAFVIGASGGKCRLSRYDTTDSGLTWTKAAAIGGVWTPTASGVRGPTGAVGHPCRAATPEPIALATGGRRRAIVICQVGVFETTTGPRGWQPAGDLPNGQPAAVTLLPNGHGVLLLANQGYCLGLRLARTTDSGHSWTSGPCLARSHAPTAVSINAKGDGLLASTGQQYATSDGGATWRKIAPPK